MQGDEDAREVFVRQMVDGLRGTGELRLSVIDGAFIERDKSRIGREAQECHVQESTERAKLGSIGME